MLTDELTYIKGVGPKRAASLKKRGIASCRDLLYHFPRRYLDRSTTWLVRELHGVHDEEVTIVGTLQAIHMVSGRYGKDRLEALLQDEEGGTLKLLWFQGFDWVSRLYRAGDHLAVSGKTKWNRGMHSMAHPDIDKLGGNRPALSTGRVIPIYPGGAPFRRVGLTSKVFRHIIYNLLKTRGLEMPEEILPPWIVKQYELLSWRPSVRAMHFPRSGEELGQARRRMKFEEFFFMQLILQQVRRHRMQQIAIKLQPRNALVHRYLESLPFTLTVGQQRAIKEIGQDVSTGLQMSRMLQGDVGSGKTVVAVAALLIAVGNGHQGAMMAPTEVLAEQHFKTLHKVLRPLGVRVCYLVGGQRAKERRSVLGEIEAGQAHIVVGTHALFQEKVVFKNLALVVIDEQHRFGVQQRASLQEKGNRPHTLLMTATPIPRSLALTTYGDLDLSLMTELPSGRKPVKTVLFGERRRPDMLQSIRREVFAGRQVFVIYPQVEESETSDLKDAENAHRAMQKEFSEYTVGLVHGRMDSETKEDVMAGFAEGHTDILVATTVIEVGIDVPNASLIVIEHAERFGLSQLHQLRGRVGRGTQKSFCILMADFRQTREAAERLKTLTKTNDGFKISDKDLEIRGSGDLFGTRQHGMPELKVADIIEDRDLLEQARSVAEELMVLDPGLRQPEHGTLREYYDTFVGTSIGRLFQVG